jgi:uncharacterized RDD family membrane protein YckC
VHVERSDCAGWFRRAWAVFIDGFVVAMMLLALANGAARQAGTEVSPAPTPTASVATLTVGGEKIPIRKTKHWDSMGSFLGAHVQWTGITFDSDGPLGFMAGFGSYLGLFVVLAAYLALLVGLVGQSFGMMITGLRVVTTDFRPPGIWRALWRYTIGWILWFPIVCVSPIMRRVMFHDRISGTRLITSERVLARAASQVNYSPD